MAFPPSAYAERGGIGTLVAYAEVEAAFGTQHPGDDEPDPDAPAAIMALPDPDNVLEAAPLAA
jgi:ParB family chromosome partitioning protein